MLVLTVLLLGCKTIETKTEISYIIPDIPKELIAPCDDVEYSITTNGELLMSYISLQTAYLTCSSKVLSISMILKSYADIYETSESNETDKSNENDNIE